MKKRMMSLISLALVGAMILPNAVIADEAAADEGKVLNIQVCTDSQKPISSFSHTVRLSNQMILLSMVAGKTLL